MCTRCGVSANMGLLPGIKNIEVLSGAITADYSAPFGPDLGELFARARSKYNIDPSMTVTPPVSSWQTRESVPSRLAKFCGPETHVISLDMTDAETLCSNACAARIPINGTREYEILVEEVKWKLLALRGRHLWASVCRKNRQQVTMVYVQGSFSVYQPGHTVLDHDPLTLEMQQASLYHQYTSMKTGPSSHILGLIVDFGRVTDRPVATIYHPADTESKVQALIDLTRNRDKHFTDQDFSFQLVLPSVTPSWSACVR